MKVVTKYEAYDGTEFTSAMEAMNHEMLLSRAAVAMAPLGRDLDVGQYEYVQHTPEAFLQAKRNLMEIVREVLSVKTFPVLNNDADEIHPMSIVGRIIDDCRAACPLRPSWYRLCKIDKQGREFNQPYFALNGPADEHKCIEDRRGKETN